MNHNLKSITILTTTQNFAWNSMQEIIPGIEEVWKEIAKNQKWQLTLINVDKERPSKYLQTFLTSDLIVCSAFNTQIALFIQFIRKEFHLDQPIIFYLHGLATIGLWPLKRFGIFDLLTTRDIFIGTCAGDLASLNIILSDFKYIQSRFYLLDKFPTTMPKKTTGFIMVTRLSPQKNIIQTINSYIKLDRAIKENYPLIIYGSEDHLGYPNLGISVNDYLEQITSVIKEHKAESHVLLKGFVPREVINLEMSHDQIFISVSTHSDENFGMAALRSLLFGQKAILSNWGGHKNFTKNFKGQITYVDVEVNSTGLPAPIDIENALLESIKSKSSNEFKSLPIYSKEEIAKDLYDDLTKCLADQKKDGPLNPRPIFSSILETQKNFEKENKIMQCFKSTEDQNYLELINAYLK